MRDKNFEPILDAYQLTEGSIVKEKDHDEIFEIGVYDAEKRGYTAFPFEDGIRFDDFTMVISESELMDNYLIESKKDDEKAEHDLLSDEF